MDEAKPACVVDEFILQQKREPHIFTDKILGAFLFDLFVGGNEVYPDENKGFLFFQCNEKCVAANTFEFCRNYDNRRKHTHCPGSFVQPSRPSDPDAAGD